MIEEEWDKLCLFYNRKPLSKDVPILSQVPKDGLIVVGMKCVCQVEWNGDEKAVEYWSNCHYSTLTECCIKEFSIPNASVDMLDLVQNETVIDKEHIIPFNGIGECVLQLQPKAKQIEVIYITHEEEDPHKYNYDKDKTCQYYFDNFITVFQS